MISNFLYDILIGNSTSATYDSIFRYIEPGMHILDVGIGNGLMLEKFASLIKEKNLTIAGIDINHDYVRMAQKRVEKFHLEDNVSISQVRLEDFSAKTRFDALIFSMSWAFFDDDARLERFIRDNLKKNGKVFIAQTLFSKKNRLIDWLKPRLKFFTTIDFGKPVYMDSFFEQMEKLKLKVDLSKKICSTPQGAGAIYLTVASLC